MRQAPERPAAFVFPLFIWFSHLLCLLLQRETRIAIMETRKFKQVPSINRIGGRNLKIPVPVIVSSGKKNSEHERTITRPLRTNSRPISAGEPINWDEVYD